MHFLFHVQNLTVGKFINRTPEPGEKLLIQFMRLKRDIYTISEIYLAIQYYIVLKSAFSFSPNLTTQQCQLKPPTISPM